MTIPFCPPVWECLAAGWPVAKAAIEFGKVRGMAISGLQVHGPAATFNLLDGPAFVIAPRLTWGGLPVYSVYPAGLGG